MMLIIGAILILANAVWITIAGPIIFWSYDPSTSSISDLKGNWGRIAFGMPSMLGRLTYVWLLLTIADFVLAFMLGFRKKNEPYVATSVLVLSVVSITMGGGFIIGMILTVVSSLGFIEKKPLKETFIGKIFRAARLDSSVFEKIGQSTDALKNAVYVIVFINVMSGLGNGLYVASAQRILNPTYAAIATKVLFKGDVLPDITVGGIIISYIGLAVAKWLIFSAILYFILTKVAGANTRFESVGLAISLAYSPILIQLFMPLVLFNQPMLTDTWPIAFFLITNIWMGITLVMAVRKTGDLSTSKAIGITVLASSLYYAINQTLIQPNFPIQGINFTIQPVAITEFILTIGVLVGMFWGVFTRHEQRQ
jgi:hypothetical protein